jgi:hypothetical protein
MKLGAAFLMVLLCVSVADAKTKKKPAIAQLPPPVSEVEVKCKSITRSIMQIEQTGGTVSYLTADELTRATLIYNTLPPESDSKWDFAVFFNNEDESGGVMFGRENLICKSMGWDSPGGWERVKKAIRGGQWV